MAKTKKVVKPGRPAGPKDAVLVAPPPHEGRIAAQAAVQAASKLVRTANAASETAHRAAAAIAAADPSTVESRGVEAKDLADRWVVLIHMAVTSPELRAVMEADIAEMATQLRLLGPDDLRVYALMDTADGGYAVRHRVHHTDTAEPDLAIVHCDPTVEDAIGKKAAYLTELIRWRFSPASRGEFETAVSRFGKTLLILWGHSQGVAAALSTPGSPAYAMVGNGGFGFSEFTGDSLSLPQIRRAIAAGLPSDKRIDILSFDSCFMSAAEVSAEFQPVAPAFIRLDGDAAAMRSARDRARQLGDDPARVDFVVASQSAVLLDGLDYGRIVDVFLKSPRLGSVSAEHLGRSLLEQANSTSDSPVSLSMLYTGDPGNHTPRPYEEFSHALRQLVVELSLILDTGSEPPTPDTPPERQRISPQIASKLAGTRGNVPLRAGANRSEWLRVRAAFETATWHRVRQFIDVGDLCRRLANNCRTPPLRTAALAVLRTLQMPPLLQPFSGQSLVVDVRSLPPLLLSGVSLYCPWLFPTPEEVRNGAWNAVVDLYDYATDLWFNRGSGSWGAFVYHAKHVLEESRQRAINTELNDLRTQPALRTHRGDPSPSGPTPPSAPSAPGFRSKEGQDKFQTAEPLEVLAGAPSSPTAGRRRAQLAADAATQGPLNQVSICPTRRN